MGCSSEQDPPCFLRTTLMVMQRPRIYPSPRMFPIYVCKFARKDSRNGRSQVCMSVIPPKRLFPQDSSAIEQPDSKAGRPKAVADTTGALETKTNQDADIVKDYQSGDAQHEGSFGEMNADPDHSTTGDPHVQVGDGNPVGGIENPPEPHASERATSGTADVSTEFLHEIVGWALAIEDRETLDASSW